MTTRDIRQQMMERMNGKVMAGPDDDPFEHPMTFNEAVRAAEGFMEELGVVGHFSLKVEYERYSTGNQKLEWRFYCWPNISPFGDPISVKSEDIAAGLGEFRARLVRFAEPCSTPNLSAVGCPKLSDAEGASA